MHGRVIILRFLRIGKCSCLLHMQVVGWGKQTVAQPKRLTSPEKKKNPRKYPNYFRGFVLFVIMVSIILHCFISISYAGFICN